MFVMPEIGQSDPAFSFAGVKSPSSTAAAVVRHGKKLELQQQEKQLRRRIPPPMEVACFSLISDRSLLEGMNFEFGGGIGFWPARFPLVGFLIFLFLLFIEKYCVIITRLS